MDSPPPVVQRFSGTARFFIICAAAGFALIPFLFLSRVIEYHGYHIGEQGLWGKTSCFGIAGGLAPDLNAGATI